MKISGKFIGLAAMAVVAVSGCAGGASVVSSSPLNDTDHCIQREVQATRRFSDNSIGGTMVSLKNITPACVKENNGMAPSFYAGVMTVPAPGK